MPVSILPPTPALPVPQGFVRHQFILVVDRQEFDRLNSQPLGLYDFLLTHFGGALILAEKVMSGGFHGWHLWVDYLKEEQELYFGGEK